MTRFFESNCRTADTPELMSVAVVLHAIATMSRWETIGHDSGATHPRPVWATE